MTAGPGPQQAPAQPTGTNGLAVAGFVLALLGLLISWMPALSLLATILALTGLVLSAVGLGSASRLGAGRGLATAGIVLGVLGALIAVLLSLVFVGVGTFAALR